VALPTVADAKAVLRIEVANDDTLLAQLLNRAIAMVETHLGAPVVAGRTFGAVSKKLTSWATVRSARSGNVSSTDATSSTIIPNLTDHPDWTTRLEFVVAAAVLDVVVDLYQRPNAAVASESEGGISRSYVGDSVVSPLGLPPRVVAALRPVKADLARWANG
jgi:hypothetical protein